VCLRREDTPNCANVRRNLNQTSGGGLFRAWRSCADVTGALSPHGRQPLQELGALRVDRQSTSPSRADSFRDAVRPFLGARKSGGDAARALQARDRRHAFTRSLKFLLGISSHDEASSRLHSFDDAFPLRRDGVIFAFGGYMKVFSSCLGSSIVLMASAAIGAPLETGAAAKSAVAIAHEAPHATGDAGPAEVKETREAISEAKVVEEAKESLDAGAKESKEPQSFRHAYIEETRKREHDIVNRHSWTPEMIASSSKHWRRAYRALRIRELAEDAGDATTVARADAQLMKTTDHFLSLLAELAARAPEVPGPPTVTAPSAGAELAKGSTVTFKMAPYKDATNYYCWLSQSDGHSWTNYEPKVDAYPASPECTITADDPRWSKFHAGKAEFLGRAKVLTKSSDGREYKLWTDPVKVDVTISIEGAGVSPSKAPSLASATPEGGAK